ANRLAHLLQRKGIGIGTIVPVLLERSIDSLVGILGIIKAGGAILPIDTVYPAERIRFILKDCKARLLVTRASYVEKLDSLLNFVEPDEGNNECPENLGVNYQADDTLYVIYTSGTTGEPKGTILEHYNLINLVYHTKLQTSIDLSGNVLQFANSSFDVCYQEIFSTMLNGGTLHIIDDDDKKDVPTLIHFIDKNKIRTIFLPTAFFKLFGSLPAEFKQLASLVNHIIVAGEKLLISDDVRAILSESSVVLHNHYGPSETHVITTYPMSGPHYPSVPPIGKPIANSQILILDRDRSLTPIGCMGELYVSGDAVGKGYLNRSELDLQKFTNNPYDPAKRMYRTGDYAKWLPDGNIEFLGRVDYQLKIRGYRVELREIESRLFMLDLVRESFVTIKEDRGQTHIVAYVVLKEDAQTTEVQKKLMTYLPEYMVPSLIIPVDKLPFTPNGKVDSKALPDPRAFIESEMVYEAPRDSIEQQLCELWVEILGDQQIGIHDHFFQVGGQSLKATVLAARIQQSFQTHFSVKDVFLLPTIAEMGNKIRTELDELNDILSIINEVEEII
ncbi:non-ribosomal peptide synthetase, partial [Paenibacillus dendritiformis]|uniref:non-ribosomal peptide synthetase n=1 Tax=Paenibacillus dendritiformis TaxID=130049 RepID=UPI00387E1D7F